MAPSAWLPANPGPITARSTSVPLPSRRLHGACFDGWRKGATCGDRAPVDRPGGQGPASRPATERAGLRPAARPGRRDGLQVGVQTHRHRAQTRHPGHPRHRAWPRGRRRPPALRDAPVRDDQPLDLRSATYCRLRPPGLGVRVVGRRPRPGRGRPVPAELHLRRQPPCAVAGPVQGPRAGREGPVSVRPFDRPARRPQARPGRRPGPVVGPALLRRRPIRLHPARHPPPGRPARPVSRGGHRDVRGAGERRPQLRNPRRRRPAIAA